MDFVISNTNGDELTITVPETEPAVLVTVPMSNVVFRVRKAQHVKLPWQVEAEHTWQPTDPR